jgi:structural maintenance of chromosome 1
MSVQLKFIELENFKSYKGHRSLGPLPSFTAVIGPNGSGKSNFMDAISFVMGEKTASLRVKRLADLIHGASIGRPVANRASVTAIFTMEDGTTEKKFTRSIIGSSSDHKIDGEAVSSQHYLRELEKLGINVNAKNFLVFQGAVESIAMKNPKERTALFEEISGSGALKKDYERLKQEVQEAEENTKETYEKKKALGLERKEAKSEKAEADKYQKLRDNLADRQMELQLFKLFHNERRIRECEEQAETHKKEVEKVEKKKDKAEEKMKEVRKEHGKSQREFAKVDSEIREKENEIQKKRPAFIKAKEKTSHIQKKVDNAKKSLTQAKKANKSHQSDVQELETELRANERRRDEYEEITASESKNQGKNLQLEDAQITEYHKMKEKAAKESARHMSDLDSINREHKSDQDRLDSENRKKHEIESKLKTKGHELEEAQKRMDKLAEHIRGSEANLEEQEKNIHDLQGDVGCSKDRIQEVQNSLEEVVMELGDARLDKHEDNRRKKKQEIVDNFKRLYSKGVYDRMINLCQPIHKKYNVAITKLLGRYMEAIVVDTEETARQCIQYLKDQMLEPETFLPLDYIQAKPLKERLRDIKHPKGVKLLFDVLSYQPPEINRAVLFVTNNALVCETPDDAMKVAYELEEGQQRYDAVALDGTFYQKSGIISGGSVDLAKKAKRWDDKQVSTLKSKKEKLAEELRQAMKNSRKESEIQTIQSQISGLKTRLKYSTTDRDTTRKKIDTLTKQLEKMRSDLECFGPKIHEIELAMTERETQIEDTKEKMNTVEDRIFKKFCSQIGVSNIRYVDLQNCDA